MPSDNSAAQTDFIKQQLRPRLARALLRLFSWMPLPLNHLTGELLGRLANLLPNDVRHVARINIRLCLPLLSPGEQKTLLRRYMIETGKTMTETAIMWLWPEQKILDKITGVTGEEHLRAGIERGKGVIIAAPHMGSWEIIGHYCSYHHPMTCMYRPPEIQALDQVIRNGRTRFGMQLAPTDTSGVKILINALRRGELVGILPDQVPQQGQGVYAPFFGHQAYSMTLLSKLAQKTGATVLYGFAERLPGGRGYHLHFQPGTDEILAEQLELSVAAMNRGIERLILTCPEQYQWGYRRYKQRPGDEAEFY